MHRLSYQTQTDKIIGSTYTKITSKYSRLTVLDVKA